MGHVLDSGVVEESGSIAQEAGVLFCPERYCMGFFSSPALPQHLWQHRLASSIYAIQAAFYFRGYFAWLCMAYGPPGQGVHKHPIIIHPDHSCAKFGLHLRIAFWQLR